MPDNRRMLRHRSMLGGVPVGMYSRLANAKDTPKTATTAPFLQAGLQIKHIETASTPGSGEFEAIISTFNVRVSYGVSWIPDDRILPGAVAASIEKGFPAIAFSHLFEENPPIGVTMAIEERGDDLYAKGRLFVGQNRLADEVFVAMSELGGDGRPPLREFSISGPIKKYMMTIEDGDEDEVRDIVELDLWEWGPCLRGANVTQLLTVDGESVTAPATDDEVEQKSKQPVVKQTASVKDVVTVVTEPTLPAWMLLPTPR